MTDWYNRVYRVPHMIKKETEPREKGIRLLVGFNNQRELGYHSAWVILNQNNETNLNHLDPVSLYVSEKIRELEYRITRLQKRQTKSELRPDGRPKKGREIKQLRDAKPRRAELIGRLQDDLRVFKGYIAKPIWFEREDDVITGYTIEEI